MNKEKEYILIKNNLYRVYSRHNNVYDIGNIILDEFNNAIVDRHFVYIDDDINIITIEKDPEYFL